MATYLPYRQDLALPKPGGDEMPELQAVKQRPDLLGVSYIVFLLMVGCVLGSSLPI